jgi:hypothetical protein
MGETSLTDVERLAGQLPLEEQIDLLEYLARQVRLGLVSRSPQDLRGIWSGRFHDDFDVDATLRGIRREWESEWAARDIKP